jgi:hypothetical protein
VPKPSMPDPIAVPKLSAAQSRLAESETSHAIEVPEGISRDEFSSLFVAKAKDRAVALGATAFLKRVGAEQPKALGARAVAFFDALSSLK